jgi:hypothetical protein
MYKSKKQEDFGKMNEKERIEQGEQHQKQVENEVKAIFKKHLVSTAPFESLQKAQNREENIKVFQAIKYNTDEIMFHKFVDALLAKNLAKFFTYEQAFNPNGGNKSFGYSALIEALMEIDEYTIPVDISKKYKTQFANYSHMNRMDLSKSRFSDFKYMVKRINWPILINHSIHYGNFGNDISSRIISDSMPEMFQKYTGAVHFKSAGYEEMLVIISYALFDNVRLLDRIAYKDKTIYVDDDMISFLRDYCLFESDTAEERYKGLHSKYVLKYLPAITIHGFEEFYQFLKKHVSDETRLLLALN